MLLISRYILAWLDGHSVTCHTPLYVTEYWRPRERKCQIRLVDLFLLRGRGSMVLNKAVHDEAIPIRIHVTFYPHV